MTKKVKTTDYEALGRLIEGVYELGYANKGRMLRLSFIKGVAVGVGGVIGATVVVSLLLWLLSILNYVPFIDDISRNVEQSIKTQTR